jgi:uncharacterized protein YegL
LFTNNKEGTNMKKNFTEMVFILDRSGSMSGLESDTVGGFNSMLEKQKQVDGACVVTTVLFDNRYELLHDRVDLQGVRPITEKEYFVRGSTALLDAVGRTIDKVRNAHKYTARDMRPDKVLFVIITDGMENASREYTGEKIRGMIRRLTQEEKWEFLFLGANIDAEDTANQYGIPRDRAVDYHGDGEGVRLNFATVSQAAADLRSKNVLSPDWGEEIRRDYRERKKK